VRGRGAGHGDVYLSFFRPFLASFSTVLSAGFCFMPGSKPPPWIMKSVDHAVEDRVVVVAGFHVGQEVGNRLRRFFVVEFDLMLPLLVVMSTLVMVIVLCSYC
jgi:hypothetical protein